MSALNYAKISNGRICIIKINVINYVALSPRANYTG
jgi:hypothetical protein